MTALDDLKLFMQNYLLPKYFLGSQNLETGNSSEVYFQLRLIKACQHTQAAFELLVT
jgi:hypothetical protein